MDMHTPQLKAADFRSEVKPIWCPGCGHYAVLSALTMALAELGLPRHKVALISGIGCSSRVPAYTNLYGFHGVHGRALAVATGLKLARPDLTVIVCGGDGDGFSIGGNHFMHACRRNVDLTYVVMDNQVYGMTKGQASPTTEPDWAGSKLTPEGPGVTPVQPVQLALACGANFVARGFSGQPPQLARMMLDGIRHPGFSVIHALSPCVTYRPEQRNWKTAVKPWAGEAATSAVDATRALLDDTGFQTGVFLAGQRRPFGTTTADVSEGVKTESLAASAREFLVTSEQPPGGGASVPYFLAHSLTLETEAAKRYSDLADILDTHNNPEVAQLFRDMQRYSRLHAEEVERRAETVGGLPHLAAWDYVWFEAEAPEAAPLEDVHYLMTPRQALEIALACERRAHGYYRRVAEESADPQVVELARTFAEEELGHVNLLTQWLNRIPATPAAWTEDLDGPRSPD